MDELQRKSVEEFKTSKKQYRSAARRYTQHVKCRLGFPIFWRLQCRKDIFVRYYVLTSTSGNRKTALGATESVDWEYHENAVELLNNLVKDGWIPLVIEQVENSIKLNDFKPEPNKNIW